MTDSDLEKIYREHLEEAIVLDLSGRLAMLPEQALSLYYTSRLADRIHEGEWGVQYLDHKLLTDILEQELRTDGRLHV